MSMEEHRQETVQMGKRQQFQLFIPTSQGASSHINDTVHCSGMLQVRLLAGSSPRQTLSQRHVNFPVVSHVPSTTRLPQRKGLNPSLIDVNFRSCQLKYVKGVSSVTHLSCVKPVINVKHAAQNLPVGARLPYTNTGTVQEISHISCPRSDLPVQSSAFRSVHSTLGVHCSSKRGETDGHTQGYKDPPVPRRLVGEGQIPPGLSPAYSGSSKNMPRTRLDGEFGKVRTGTKAHLRFCRLPIRPQGWSGPTDTGLLAKPSGQNNRNTVTTSLSGPAVHVPYSFVNSQREGSSPRPTTHETLTVASQKQLESTQITR